KVDGLFNALDTNGDGSMSLDELTSAAEASHAAGRHGHHHHRIGSDQGADGGKLQAVLNSGTQGANADTTSNPDGSNTTTITYADGSKVSLTSPPQSDSAGATSSSGSASEINALEQLIRLQAQSLTPSTGNLLASI